MKNLVTCLLFVFGFVFAGAQQHPPKPKETPLVKHFKQKVNAKNAEARAERGSKPQFVTPSGKKIQPGKKGKARPHKPSKPNRPHPPKPKFLR